MKYKNANDNSGGSNTIWILLIVAIVAIVAIVIYNRPITILNNDIVSGGSGRDPNHFFDIYYPPLRNNQYTTYPFRSTNGGDSGWQNATPTGVSFNPFRSTVGGGDTRTMDFTQVGILKANDQTFLPLFGKPKSTKQDTWYYYTISNTGTIGGIKLNIKNERGRNLMDDTGSPELYDADKVIVDGYDKQMSVSLYPQKNISYII
jgi:hypothetical protein